MGARLEAENHSAVKVLMRKWLFQNGNGALVPSHAALCPCLGVEAVGTLCRALQVGRMLEAPKGPTLDPQWAERWVVIFSWLTSSFSPGRYRAGAWDNGVGTGRTDLCFHIKT